MEYNPTQWATGDVITAQKLNKMETGIAGAGLQLYGPYTASGAATVEAGAGESASAYLQTLKDVNGNTVGYPEDTDALILVSGFGAGSVQTCAVQGVWGPYVYNGSWEGAGITLMNTASSEASGSVSVTFYSTVEFPQAS